MTNPLDPLHQLADTTNLPNLTNEQLYDRDRQLRATLNDLPSIAKQLREARQTIARELRTSRKLSWGTIATGYGVSRTRIQQLVQGDDAAQRRERAQPSADDPDA